jgi:hypothetical protein
MVKDDASSYMDYKSAERTSYSDKRSNNVNALTDPDIDTQEQGDEILSMNDFDKIVDKLSDVVESIREYLHISEAKNK